MQYFTPTSPFKTAIEKTGSTAPASHFTSPDLPGNPPVHIYIYVCISMKIIVAECCESAASKPGQAQAAAAPSSTQAPAMGVLKKPASKQGILKTPSAAQNLAMVPCQAAQEEPEDEEAEQDDVEEDEEEVQEQPEEEGEEGDDDQDEEGKLPKKRRLSRQALQDHNPS